MAPKDSPLVQFARAHTEEMVMILVDIARSGEKEAARASAAIAVLNRAWGTPTQSVEITPNKEKEFDLSALTPDELKDYHKLLGKIVEAQGPQDAEVVPDEYRPQGEATMKLAQIVSPDNPSTVPPTEDSPVAPV